MEYENNLNNVIAGMSKILPELGENIESCLKQLNTEVALNGTINRRSINIDSEVFFMEFLNILFDWELRIANFAGHNEPGVDLVSEKDGVVVQVSSRSDREKIKDSLKKTPDTYKIAHYRFCFATMQLKHDRYEKSFDEHTGGLLFDHTKDVYDLNTLTDEVHKAGAEKTRRLSDLVDSYFRKKEIKDGLGLGMLGDKDAKNVFQFNSGAVKLFGREEEMKKLREFALGDDGDRFRWFAIAAAGGAGKTRLAYELQKELLATGEWTCVLLSNRAWGRLSELSALYPGKTLFIADYVAPHIKELGEWIKELSGEGHKRYAPLRLLLLERDTRDENGQVSWYESIVAYDYEKNRPYGEGCPYELKQIGSEAMPRLIRDFAGFSAKKAEEEGEKVTALPRGDEENVWKKLGEIDPVLERPLFAMILTDAWLRDPEAKRWGREELLREIVSREKAVLEKRIKAFHAPGNNALTDACLHLWMAATVMGTGGHVGAEKLLSLMPQEAGVITRCAETHALELDSIDLKGHEKLLQTAGIFENGEIVPMLPDLIGEFFVYSELKSIPLSRRIWKAAIEDRDSAFEFFKRLLKDFGPMIALKKDTEKDEYRRRFFPEDPGLDDENTTLYARLLRDLFDEPNEIAVRRLPAQSLVALAGSREGETAENARVFNDAGSVCSNLGQHGLALDVFKKAVAASEKANGINNDFTSAVYNNIALVYRDMGDYGSALDYLKKSIKIKEKAPGPDDPDTAVSYANIALVYQDMGDYGSALDYLKTSIKIKEKAPGPDDPDTAVLYSNIASVYRDMGDYGSALDYLKKSIKIREKVPGTDDLDTAQSHNNIAGVYKAMGDYDSALEYYTKALGVYEKTLGTDHPSTATTYNNIAGVYQDMSDYDSALEYYTKALGVREKALGTDHPDTATTYNNIAGVYQDMSDYDSALEYYTKALGVYEKALGTDHPSTATTYNNIAGVYQDMGDYGSALEYNKKALGVREKALGTDHPDTAQSYNNIALVYQDMGDYGSALKYSKKALGVCKKALGPDHPNTAATYNNIAQVYYAMGDYGSALKYMKKDLAISEKALGTDHPSTATTYNNIAGVYQDMGDYGSALEYYTKALGVYEKALGTDHTDTATTYNNIANVYQAMGEYGSALEYYTKALGVCKKALGTDHPDTAATYNNIALVYQDMGDYGSALEYYTKALGVYEKALGPDHPDTATTYNNIALVYKAMGDYDSALEYMKKDLAISEKALGTDHPSTAATYNNIASVYRAMGDYGSALKYSKKALGVLEKALGTDHPDTAVSYVNLGSLYLNLEKPEEALPLFEKALGVFEARLGHEHPYTGTTREWKEYAESLLR